MTLSKDDANDNVKKFNMSSMQMTNKSSMPGAIKKDPNNLIAKFYLGLLFMCALSEYSLQVFVFNRTNLRM